MSNWLQGLRINRVALVDRGANQDAHIVLFKRKDKEPDMSDKTDDKSLLERVKALFGGKEPAEVTKALTDMEKRAADAEKAAAAATEQVAKLEEQGAVAKAIAFAKSLGHLPGVTADDFGSVLRKIQKAVSAEEYAKFEKMLTGANVAVSKSGLFAEIGSGGDGETTAKGKLDAIAADLRKANPKLSKAQAFQKAWQENPALRQQHLTEDKPTVTGQE